MSYRSYSNFDSGTYGRSRETNRAPASHTADRPTTVTAKYLSTSSQKSSSIPVLSSEHSTTKETTPISTIANRYINYSKLDNKPTLKYDKKDYSDKSTAKYDKKNYTDKPSAKFDTNDYCKITVPKLNRSRKELSPVSIPSKYNLTRLSRQTSPERKSSKTDKSRDPSPVSVEKNIPNKTNKSTSYNSLSSYKLYPRSSSYVRPSARTETKPEITVNRYAIANRLSSTYLGTPSTRKSASVSPTFTSDQIKSPNKIDHESSLSLAATEEDSHKNKEECNQKQSELTAEAPNDDETEIVTYITRHTSPTPPGSSAYVRTRRADMAKTIEKTVKRSKRNIEMVDKEVQSDRLDDTARTSRFAGSSRTSTTNWSYYTPHVSSYTGYAGRYSTQYSNLREHSSTYSDRSSRSKSHELQSLEENSVSELDCDKKQLNNNLPDSNKENLCSIEENQDGDTADVVINVNLKLKRAQSPPNSNTTEFVFPEITITNSQLPPQAPKSEVSTKPKKLKARKSSSDSDSSVKKKTVKKKCKSNSPSDSESSSVSNNRNKESSASPPKITQSISSTNIRKQSPTKHSKSRESQSPESSITLSTQSSVSEDDSPSKSKTNDVSRTSADETSIPTDHSAKRTSPVQKSENGAEEAKSFLIRALAPVTNLFKMKYQDSSENNNWPDNSTSESTGKDVSNLLTESEKSSKGKHDTSDIVATNNDNLVKLKSIKRIESGEKAWWLESDNEQGKSQNEISSEKNSSKKMSNNSEDNVRWSETNGKGINKSNDCTDNSNMKYINQRKFMDDEKPWWLDSSANIPEGIERLTPPRKSSSESEKSEKYNFFKVRHTESGEKDWWLTSNENSSNNNNKSENQNSNKSSSDQKSFPLRRIRHIESGERPWWLSSDKNIPEGIEKLPTPPPQDDSDSSDSEEVQLYVPPQHPPPFPTHLPDDEPLGTRRSPEGLEMPKQTDEYIDRTSPYENNYNYFTRNQSNSQYQKGVAYISRYTDIDDILGTSGQIYSPFMDSILAKRTGQVAFDEDECEEIDPTQVRIHDSTPQRPVIKKLRGRGEIADYGTQLDDATLQVFKDGDYGPYLDLDSTLIEQEEDIEGLQDSRKNAIILRTQLSVRVHTIIERLLHSQGRELRRALFTLKQILQSDKDLVHEFVANKGLDCLMQVSSMADHNYLDYILRALGQILLYVDGMHGVMAHKRCVQWLYSLIASKYRHVVKTALKLLLVFVEYTEKNCLLLIDAINTVDHANGRQPWYNIMKILKDFDASDTELLIYATTLINRCLNNVPDRDTYYDQVDALQDQGMDDIIQLYMSKQGTDLDLLRQLQIFESVLLYEDGDESGTALKQLDESVINSVRRRSLNLKNPEIRKSKKQLLKEKADSPVICHSEHEPVTASSPRLSLSPVTTGNKENKDTTTAFRRRQDRYSRQAHHIQQQEMLNSIKIHIGITDHSKASYTNRNNIDPSSFSINGNVNNINIYGSEHYNKVTSGQHEDNIRNGNQRYTAGLKQRIQNGTLGHSVNAVDAFSVIRQKQHETPEVKDDREILLNREHSIKDLAQRLTSPVSPTTEDKPLRVSDMAGIVSKAKEELAKSQSKEVIKSPTIEIASKIHDIKISENDLYWEELKKGCLNREFHLCDLDFSDLRQDSDEDVWSPAANAANCPPPPPPAMFNSLGNPPPMPKTFASLRNSVPAPPPKPPFSSEASNDSDSSTIKKNKKTVKLFWREIQENPVPATMRPKVGGFIWDDLPEVPLDTKMLEYLFESKTNDLIIKEKLMEPKRNLILDAKRSNAINIAMKKLPTPQTIKAAIMKMDATVIGREGIEKLLTMLPTEEEKIKIQEAQYANPDLPLGSAEQFLLTLASINELSSRLKLWVFKLDFDNLEKEIAEPLMDLKQGIELLKINKTFKVILSTLRSVGSFLNGSQVKGFRLEYLSKVMEVKDTVHKHPLLYHICEMIIVKFPDSTDFFSEVGPVIRASKVDFDIISTNLMKLEADCKASWDHMKKVAKHDSSQIFKTKITEFLTDAAERIILLTIIEKRVMSRYNKFLLYLGVPPTDLSKTKPSDFLKVIAEFALEYRTTRERVLQQLEKRANHRERNKTRGKMIIDVGYFSTKNGDHTAAADSALKELLKTDPETDSLTESRRKQPSISRKLLNGDVSADDEIIETLVRSATSKRRPLARDRRRNRLSDKKNLNRTLDGTQSWPCTENNPGSTTH